MHTFIIIKMIILVPMGGKGSRFAKAGYEINKACIPTTDRHTGRTLPMVVCAMKDIPGIDNTENKIICIDREFHQANGTEEIIQQHFNKVVFIILRIIHIRKLVNILLLLKIMS